MTGSEGVYLDVGSMDTLSDQKASSSVHSHCLTVLFHCRLVMDDPSTSFPDLAVYLNYLDPYIYINMW